jgi:hypothetical protein
MYWNFVVIDSVIKNQLDTQQDATLKGKNYKVIMIHKLEPDDCPKCKTFARPFKLKWMKTKPLHSARCLEMWQLFIQAGKLIAITWMCGVLKIAWPLNIRGICQRWTVTEQHHGAKSWVSFSLQWTLSMEVITCTCRSYRTWQHGHLSTRQCTSSFHLCSQIPECHTTRPLDWESWSCRWRLAEAASLLSWPHSISLVSARYVKQEVFVPPLLLDVSELKLRNTTAIEIIYRNMLERVWDEMDYRQDICWVTNAANNECLYGV